MYFCIQFVDVITLWQLKVIFLIVQVTICLFQCWKKKNNKTVLVDGKI